MKKKKYIIIYLFPSNFAVFESDTDDCKEYRDAYEEYKNLVDLLLGCYMEDIGITPDQFELACHVNRYTKMPITFQQVYFIFKKIIIIIEEK